MCCALVAEGQILECIFQNLAFSVPLYRFAIRLYNHFHFRPLQALQVTHTYRPRLSFNLISLYQPPLTSPLSW